MRFALVAALVLAGSCAPKVEHRPPEPGETGTRPPDLKTPHVRGEGIEARFIRGRAGIGEIHEALQLASSERRTDQALQAAGLEVHVIRDRVGGAFTRGLMPLEAPELGWMGLPVQWRRIGSAQQGELLVRGWPIVSELGPRTVVELALRTADGVVVREYLLRPGTAMVVTAGLGRWPEALDARQRSGTTGADVFHWSGDGDGGTGALLLVPRYGGQDG